MAITSLTGTPECRMGHLGPLLVAVWNSRLTVPALEALEEHHRLLAAQYGKVTFLSVVVSAVENPGGEVRERLSRTANELMALRRVNLIVVMTRGLGAIITRSVLAAMSLLSAEKLEVFKSLDEAAQFLQHLPGQAPELAAALNLEADLRAFIDAQA